MILITARLNIQQHVALIFDEGYVTDFYVDKSEIKFSRYLLKLPTSTEYYGYSDDVGNLYLIHDNARKPITKIPSKLTSNSAKHRTVPNSKRKKNEIFHYGLLVGNTFWTFGRDFSKGKNSLFS